MTINILITLIIILVTVFINIKVTMRILKKKQTHLDFCNTVIKSTANELLKSKQHNDNMKKSLKNLKEYIELKYTVQGVTEQIVKLSVSENGNVAFVLNESQKENVFDIHIISGETLGRGLQKNGRPYAQTEIREDTLEIVDIPPNDYQNRGYGSLMLDAIIEKAMHSNVKRIVGTLSYNDADTEEKRKHRNQFYEKRGFKVIDNDKGFGRIEKTL